MLYFYSTQTVPQKIWMHKILPKNIQEGSLLPFQELSLLPPGGRRLVFTGNLWLNFRGPELAHPQSSTNAVEPSTPMMLELSDGIDAFACDKSVVIIPHNVYI